MSSSDKEMNMSRVIYGFAALLMLGIAISTSTLAQDWSLPPLPTGTHALDSLLGKWHFSQEGHIPQFKAKGTWTFSRMGDGFMIFDEYRTDNGSGGTVFLGETYRAYNPEKNTWTFEATQYAAPKIALKNGEWDAGRTRFENGDIIDEISKGDVINRFRFYNIKKNSFSLIGETSKDGKAWVNTMDIECVRAHPRSEVRGLQLELK
jgi:hypothetical protein